MSVKLIVQNIPPNLSPESFIKAFSDLRGFVNGTLLVNQQNELYNPPSSPFSSNSSGIVDFTSYELADFARKIRSNFKFPGSHHPIIIDFYKSQDPYDYYPGSASTMNTPAHNINNMSMPPVNSLPPPGTNLQMGYGPSGPNQTNFPAHQLSNLEYQQPPPNFNYQSQPNEVEGQTGPYMQPRYPGSSGGGGNIQNNEMFNMSHPTQLATLHNQPSPFPYQGNSTQFIQHGVTQGLPPLQSQSSSSNPPNLTQHMSMGPKQGVQPGNTGMMSQQAGNVGFQNVPQNINNPQNGTPGLAVNPNLGLNSPNLRNIHQRSPLNSAMGSFTNILSQIPFNQVSGSQQQQQQFSSPQGSTTGSNMSFMGNQSNMSKPGLSNDDLIMFKTPSKATSSIYVDGVPIDATEREVAHVFRPFPGFKEVRLIKKEAKSGRKFYFCFVDFENPLQSTIALHTLQGYRFDKSDKKGLQISYAFHAQAPTKQQYKKQKRRN